MGLSQDTVLQLFAAMFCIYVSIKMLLPASAPARAICKSTPNNRWGK